MTIKDAENIVLESDILYDPRTNFNEVLQRLLKNMLDSSSTEGSITLKIDISMQDAYIPNYDPDIPGETRKIWKPSFKHKVSSAITVKDELSGKKNPEMELIWDEDRHMYVLANIANTDQRSIFDKDAPWNQNDGMPEQQALETNPEKTWMNTDLLPGEVADESALPGEVQDSEDDVIDADFTEIEEEDGEIDEEEPDVDEEDYNGFTDDGYGYEEPEDPDESEE